MSSTPSPRPTAETRPNQSKKTQHGGQTLDLSPHDLKKYLSQPVRSIFHEQAKSIVAIQELQHEVSSLLEFKNALLETFPHLQSRMSASSTALSASSHHLSGSTGELANARKLSALDANIGGSTGQLNQFSTGGSGGGGGHSSRLVHHPHQTYVARHLDVVSSDDTQPSWNGIQHTQVNSNGQASSSGVSSGPPGSNHVGSLNHARPAIIRRSHDSGFDMISSSNNTREQQSPLKSVPSAMDMHVRWIQDPTTTTTIGGLGANNPHDPLDHLINPATLGGDELMHLLDLIQAKSEKLKSEVDPQQKRALQAINEDSSPIEVEVEQLRREKLLLLQRVSELESGAISGQSSASRPRGEGSSNMSGAGDSESSISGIVHSVHIRTGGIGGDQTPSVTSISPPKRTSNNNTRSASQSDLLSAAKSELTTAELQQQQHGGGGGVHIEIKNLSKSQDHLAGIGSSASSNSTTTGPSPRLKSNTSGGSSGGGLAHGSTAGASGSSRRSNPQGGSVSVINLKQTSVDNLPHRASSSGDLAKGRYMSPNRHTFGQPTKSQILRPNSLLPGRMVMGIKARTSNSNSNNSKDLAGNSNNNSKIKSHSVENLMDPTSSVLGLKSANSETLLNYPNYARRRLSGTTSELNVNRIGTSEKVKVFETLEGVTSLPVELTKGLKGQVKPNRDKIRAILSMSSVIELQRHLLTTVMENEVYKTQLERVSEGWTNKMSNFERLNSTLRSSLSELQSENNELKTLVTKQVSELDLTRARLRSLEQNVDHHHAKSKSSSHSNLSESPGSTPTVGSPRGGAHHQQQNPIHNPTKSENRVHFDLNNHSNNSGVASSDIRKPARSTPRTNTSSRPNNIHLPSDARQRLEQLATAAGVTVVSRDQPSRLGSPIRTNLLDPIQEMTPPASVKAPQQHITNPKRPTSSLPLNNNGLNNNNNKNGGGPVQRVRRESVGGSRSRPSTPSGRDVRALNLNNLSKSHPTVEMPTEQASPADLLNSMDKKDSLSHLGRDTIADLIAGIIERNSISSEAILQKPAPKLAFVDDPETETEFTAVTLSPAVATEDHALSKKTREELAGNSNLQQQQQSAKLFFKRNSTSSNHFHSLPHESSMQNVQSGGNSNSKDLAGNSNGSMPPNGQSWEAFNLMEEMTHGSHVRHKLAGNSNSPIDFTTMEIDSLSARYQTHSMTEGILEEEDEELAGNSNLDVDDSLNFNLQETVDEDSLTGGGNSNSKDLAGNSNISDDEDYYEHDSLQVDEEENSAKVIQVHKLAGNSNSPIAIKGHVKKRLIIPYNESFSSTNSIFTGTSQDGSLDSCTKQQTEEIDSLTQSNPNLTLNMAPIKPWLNELAGNSNIQQQPSAVMVNKLVNLSPPSGANLYSNPTMTRHSAPIEVPSSFQVPIQIGSNPDLAGNSNFPPKIGLPAQPITPTPPTTASPSLMKLATERMKRKFLGWN